ncbi:MAG: heme-binding protein [Myxococcota bacterium]|nr:heme-binding protein [Myxococcota bacterium]
MSNILLITASAMTGLLGVWMGYTAFYEGRLASPNYTVISAEENFEVRHYSPILLASTSLKSQEDGALSQGFRTLAGFIFGGNERSESLAMTAPVLQQNGHGVGLLSPASPEGMTMAFVMPIDRSFESIPKPNQRNVELNSVSWGTVASIRFSGRASTEDFRNAEAELRGWMSEHGYAARGSASYAQYNSPSAFPALRRNEVLIQIEQTEL